MFCEKKSYKKDKCLINVALDESSDTLEERDKVRGNINMDYKVGTIYSKLFVYEAKCHTACHSKYLKTKHEEQASHNETLYTATL